MAASNFVDLQDYPFEQLIQGTEPVSLDTETLGATRETNIPIYFSSASRDYEAIAGPTTTVNGYNFLHALCAAPRAKVFQNMKFDMWALWRYFGLEVEGPIEDTIIMHCLLDEHHLGHHKLKVLSRELLGRARFDEILLKREQRKVRYNTQLPQQLLHDYSKPDAIDTLDLYYLFKPQLEAQHLWGLYRSLIAAELVYLKMFKRGVAVDLERCERTHAAILIVLDELQEKIWVAFGERFKISSPKQLGNVLAKHFPLKVKTKNGDGNWCTDKDTLEPFRDDPRMQVLLAWKFLDKARQYLKGYKKRAVNGRLYSDYRQTTVTGRSRSSDPNLENIPKQRGRISEVEVGDAELAKHCAEAFRQVRACITAAPGAKLLALDYKQIEYRCFAYNSNSERLIAALERGEDFHTYVCQLVFGEETEQLRYITKIINYGLIYGMGNDLLITRIKMYHPGNPAGVLEKYERMLPEMRETQRRLKALAASKGYLIDPFGRRYRYLPDRPHAVVAWLNQGTAANIKKEAMVKTDKVLEERRSGLALEIHDELIFEMFPEDAYLARDIHSAMEDFHQLGRIPVLTDIAVGPNLLDTENATIEEAIAYLQN